MSGYEDEELSGFIFMCNSNTKPQCYQYRVFGLPFERLETARKVKCGTKLFLYDFQVKLLYGIYEAASSGHLNIQPNAFNGSFPSQVSFRIYKDCLPIPENIFKHVIRESYNGPKFRQELTSEQVKGLMELFRPIHVEATYSRELHQHSTSYQRRSPPPPPQGWYYSGTQQTGHRQDSAYFYKQYGREIPHYYGTQVAGPHSETRNISAHPPHFPVNDPNERDVNASFHGIQPSHHAIAAAAQPRQGYANPSIPHTFYHSSPYHHYNSVTAQRTVQSHTYAVPHQDDGAGPCHGHVRTNEANYYAHGAPYHPQYSGHHVVATYQPYNENSMYQQQQLPSYEHQHHGSAAAVSGQLQVYEPNLPSISSRIETSCSSSN